MWVRKSQQSIKKQSHTVFSVLKCFENVFLWLDIVLLYWGSILPEIEKSHVLLLSLCPPLPYDLPQFLHFARRNDRVMQAAQHEYR